MKIYIKTYGCQMNERDSEALAGMLSGRGHEIVNEESAGDVLLFNTCSVREQAERKAIGKVGFMKKLKAQKPHLIIGVIGCMAQRLGDSLFKELPHIDFVLGTGMLHTLPELIETIVEERQQLTSTQESSDVLTGMSEHYLAQDGTTWSAQIAVTRGCNRFCSYCIVPYVRGREISREIDDICNEAKELAQKGVKELLLLGQNVAAFGLNGDINPPAQNHSPFADLLSEIAKIEGIERIRFTSPYVSYFNDKLIETIANTPKVCKNIHLPLQSGSNEVLRAMNRQYTAESYYATVDKIKAAMPGVTFSTDVIVGFPGESEADFIMTRDLMNKVGFDNAYIFKYSPRPGAKSAKIDDSVPQEVKEERNQILLADLSKRSLASTQKLLGSVQKVLVEGVSKRNVERWTGRTDTNRTVNFPPDAVIKIGDIIDVEITHAGAAALLGEIKR